MMLVDGIPSLPWRELVLMFCVEGNLVVTGQLCSDHGCLAFAGHTVYWPGQTSVKCDTHAANWTRIASVMGFDLVTRPIDSPRGDDDSSKRFSLMELR